MDKLRVGVIGIGRYAATTLVPAFRQTGKAEIVAICRRNPELLRFVNAELRVPGAYQDWQELLERENLDIAVVSTPSSRHCDPVIAALERGLHVLCEKPMSLRSAEANRMVDAASMANRVLTVNYTCRLHGQWRWAKKALDEGVIGPIRQIAASWCLDGRWFYHSRGRSLQEAQAKARSGALSDVLLVDNLESTSWRFKPEDAGPGWLVDCGTHLFDLILWLSGDRAAAVSAFSNPLHEGRTTSVSIAARFASGAMCSISFNDGVAGDGSMFWAQGNLSMWGDNGTLTAQWDSWNPRKATVTILRQGVPLDPDAQPKDETPASEFIDAILTGSPNPCAPEEAARAVHFMEEVLNATKTDLVAPA